MDFDKIAFTGIVVILSSLILISFLTYWKLSISKILSLLQINGGLPIDT